MGEETVAVVGLGYVGLPLALAFGRVMSTVGFDVSTEKVAAYNDGFDPTEEMAREAFKAANKITYHTDPAAIAEADYVVVAVPTPIDEAKAPDLTPMEKASVTVGRNLKQGAVVIYESTVYPGVTEDICVPILEKESGLVNGKDFTVGYSPERINPGDKEHTLERIIKVVSGQDAETLDKVAKLYERVIEAGVHRAESIKVAEAAKVIENTQRDLNISLMNELAIIFDLMNIGTHDVLKAAGTKWNFLPFKPGLVGGHCIGVDPYYLTHKAQMLGYRPEVILAGRSINDNMGRFIASKTIKRIIKHDRVVKGANVLVMGLTFKENCADIRNTRVTDVVQELQSYGVNVLVYDPVADKESAREEYGIELVELKDVKNLEAVIAAVAHDEILDIDLDELEQKSVEGAPFMDVKGAFDRDAVKKRGFWLWRL